MRSRIVLEASEGRANVDIATELGCSGVTVSKWRNRFAQRRLDGLYDNPRPGPPRRIDDAKVEEVIVKTLEETPADATHWSTRSMAQATGLSQSSISRIWRAFGLKPHRTEDFKVSPDPQFVEKVRDLAGLYMNPPDAAVVLCVDHKSQIQALDRTAPILPLLPGTPQRRTHDYRRYGTTNLGAALDTATGRVITSMTRRNRTQEFQTFLNLINREVPPELGACRLSGRRVGWVGVSGWVVFGVVGCWVGVLGRVGGRGGVFGGRRPGFLVSRRGWWSSRWWCG